MGFVSAGGYHHHLGLNTWQGRGAPPPPPDALGLRYYTIDLPTQAAYDEIVARVDAADIPSEQTEAGLSLRDPSHNGVILRVVS
jgi:catechol 2,3-dioxygenase